MLAQSKRNAILVNLIGLRHWAVVFLLFAVQLATASQAPVDSTQSKPKPYSANSTLERVVSFPGQLAYAPVRYTVLGLGYAGVYLVEKGVVHKIVSVVGGAGFTPVYAPRTGAGLRFTKLNCFTKDADLVTTASSWVDSRQLFSIDWSKVPLGAGFTSDFTVRYRSLTGEAFYGLGPESQLENKVSYSEEDVLIEVTLHKRLNRFFRASLSVGASNTSIFDGRNGISPIITEVYSDSTLPGFRPS